MPDMVQKISSGVEFNCLDTTENVVNGMLLHSLKEQDNGVNIHKNKIMWLGLPSENLL
jgi:hypothetical protein